MGNKKDLTLTNQNSTILIKKITTLAALFASIGLSSGLQAAENTPTETAASKAWISQKVTPTKFQLDLNELNKPQAWQPGDAIKDMPRRRFKPDYVTPGAPVNPVASKIDSLLAKQNAVSVSTAKNSRAVELQFDGSGYTGVNPPDTSGDVGLNYYIQSINGNSGSIFTVYDKNTGSLVSGPTSMESLGSGDCSTGAGDPIVLFDEMADRWLLSEFSSRGNNLCVYISQTSDPIAGGWFAYAFAAPSFPDYPKYGVGSDAYYVGTNENDPAVYALERDAMLAGNAATMIRIAAPDINGFGFQMITPADHDGSTDMPDGTPGYFLRHRDDEVHNSNSNDPTQDFVELWELVADFNNVNNASFTKVADFAVAEFDSDLCGLTSFNCFPQAGTNTTLDPLREVVMFRAQYRNFTSHETIVGNFVTDVDDTDHGGVRWFELRRENGSWSLFQEGTYAPDEKNRWMGSIAMDKDGNIALAYSWGSSNDFPGIRYTGRLASSATGIMSEAEFTLVNGTDRNTSNRWGDYSHMAVDPVDECTFWYTNEYGNQNGQWATSISKFKFDSCGSGGSNISPTASFTALCTQLDCSFNGSESSDPDGTIESYAWDFGDGNSSSEQIPMNIYAASGTYAVSLTVTDNEGATNVSSQDVVVDDGTAASGGFTETDIELARNEIASFTIDVPAGAYLLEVATAGGTGNVDVLIKFGSAPSRNDNDCFERGQGNDHLCSVANPAEGTWFISVRAAQASAGVQLNAFWFINGGSNIAPTSDFSFTTNDLEVSFSDASSDIDGSVTVWSWDFGDGNSSNAQNPVNNFVAAGSYDVSLTVTDDGGATGNTIQTVVVSESGGGMGGFTETDISLDSRQTVEYTIDVPAGSTSLEVDTSGGSGNVDLAIKFGASPTGNDNDCNQVGAGNLHTCTIMNPSEGTWFIRLRARSASAGVQLDAYWTQ
ncbi:MAG: PKD repeat protein [Paraglaciecola sp.]|jgi:PKD repeat protein